MSIKNKHREKNSYKIWGMEVGLLLEDAEKWWDTRGSVMMKARTFSDEYHLQQEALNATNPVHPNYIGGNSNILLGNRWELLTQKEREQVLAVYMITLKDMLNDKSNRQSNNKRGTN